MIIAILITYVGVPSHVTAATYHRRGRSPYGGRGYGARMPGTAASAAGFGMARMVAASGYANMMNSKAAQNYMAARSADFQNRAQWTNSYYQMRQSHKAYEADETHLTMDDFAKIAQDAAPKRLDITQLDPTTGLLHWPTILQDVRYIDARDELDHLFKVRSLSTGLLDADSYRDVQTQCDALKTHLKANLKEYGTRDFESAVHFVESLAYEAKFPHE